MRRGPIPISFEDAFPFGLGVVGAVTPQSDFQKSTRDNPVQAYNDGVPVWAVDVMDFDPEAMERTFRVKVTSKVQPVPPEAIPGAPVRPVILEGLAVLPYNKDVGNGRSKVAYSWSATGLAAPKRASGQQS